jgi:hypothetical protein
MQHEWKITVTTTSEDACELCEEVAAMSPFVEILEGASEAPDEEDYRPHDGCVCDIKIEYQGVEERAEYVVKDLQEGETEVTAEDDELVDTEVNQSHTQEKEVTLEVDHTEEIEYEIETHFEVVDDIASVDISERVSDSFTQSSDSDITLDPRQGVRIKRGTMETTTAVYGVLYKADDDDDDGGDGDSDNGDDEGETTHGTVLVGYIVITETENFFDEIFELD